MPYVMVRRNMARIASVMTNVAEILQGLTRGLDLSVLDAGVGEVNGHALSFFPRAHALGIVLPSNSPGVHGLWVPSIALKMPLVLRPGSSEPWTPYRIIQTFLQVGIPPEAFCYLPSDHAGAGEIVRNCGRSMFFGDLATVGAFAGDPRIELHGPGFSKIVFGEDEADRYESYLPVLGGSVADNGGRSCVNASGIWTPRHGRAMAQALAERFASIVPRVAEDPEAAIAPFGDPAAAARVSGQIDRGLEVPGAVEVSAGLRSGPRLVQHAGSTYLLPTVIHCSSTDHPLANREFLFPFVSVVDCDEDRMPDVLGPTLVVTALTKNQALMDRLLASHLIGRLNLGAVQTNAIAWDQPHEGNLFDHLYGRRAFQRAG
jgi:acyl-CoA reductase-like NAD-dependent aldehyde dehydrogenase